MAKHSPPPDPSKVKLYNHKPVGEKPVIPNAVFKQICERVAEGMTTEEVRKACEPYSLEANQKNLINAIYQLCKEKRFKLTIK